MSRLLFRFLTAYGQLVNGRPLLMQIATAGTLVAVGDTISQKVIETKRKQDFQRTAIMAACGFFYFGPFVGTWFSVLNKLRLPTFVCVALDQFVFAPPLLSGFFTIQSILNGKSLPDAIARVKSEVFGVLKVNWLVWIPAQMVNFWIIPFQFRMLFCQLVAIFWNCYLSNKANQGSLNEYEVNSMNGKDKNANHVDLVKD